jgi:hypothetical protein
VNFLSVEATMGVYMYGSGVAQFVGRASVQEVDSLMLATAEAVAPSSVGWLRSVVLSDVASPIVTSATASQTFGSTRLEFAAAAGTQNQDVFLQIETRG